MSYTTHSFPLNNGTSIPAIGLGTWQSASQETSNAVKHALLHGYRHIDTALNYGNEKEVGQGIRESGVPRAEIWLTTKLDNHWHHRVQEGFEQSLSDLGVDYLDLYLIHFPCSTDPDDRSKHLSDWDFVKTWLVALTKSRLGLKNATEHIPQARHAETTRHRQGEEYRRVQFPDSTPGKTIERSVLHYHSSGKSA